MVTEIVIMIVSLIVTIITNVVTWLLTRKKYNAEVDFTLLENMQKSLDFYKQLSDDNSKRLEEVLQRNERLEQKNEDLEKEIRELRNQIFSIMQNICYNLSCNYRDRRELFGNNNQLSKKQNKNDSNNSRSQE